MPRAVADQCADTLAAAGVTVPAAAEPDRLAAFLSGDGHVTILCGAHEGLLALGERLQAVHAMRGEERVEWLIGRADKILDLAKTDLWR